MSRSLRSTRFGMFLFVAIFGLAARLPSQSAAEAGRGGRELTSGLGRKLYSLPDDDNVMNARKNLAADPKNVDRVLQLSKAEAGRRQYKEAVATATEGLAFAPKSADLYLERGHRELGLREFKAAMNDLEQATRLAPEMLDAYYHLGLAHYFLREFDEAASSFDKARALAKNSDSLIDCSNWLYVSLRRAGKEQEAAQVLTRITPDIKNTEPHLYFYLRLLHFYQGQLTADSVLPPPPQGPEDLEGELAFDTVGYGVGNWHLYHHDPSEAADLFRKVVKGGAWNSWGFIGSEMELIRGKK
ncbi:MAG: tetratricopeptide repeat protein [Candidatus Sulfotelmatobacter sp.]